jgi:outer membrane protein OmpA-like peptidoglycan-associated protein
MRYSLFISIIVIVFHIVSTWHAEASADKEKLNAFYKQLVSAVKSDRPTAQEVFDLVRRNPETARNFLKALESRISSGGKHTASYVLLRKRLEEGLLLNKKGCSGEAVDEIISRAFDTVDLSLDDRIFFMQRATSMCPKRADAWKKLGKLYLKQLQYGMAIKAFEKNQRLKKDEETAGLIELAEKRLEDYKNSEKVSSDTVRHILEKPNNLMAPIPGKAGAMVSMRRALQMRVQFDTNSDQIKDDYKAELDIIGREIQRALKKDQRLALTIEGHADNRGTEDMNFELSKKRAESVKGYLVEKFNLNPEKLSCKSYGFYRPIAPGNNEQSYALNRRVEFRKMEAKSP